MEVRAGVGLLFQRTQWVVEPAEGPIQVLQFHISPTTIILSTPNARPELRLVLVPSILAGSHCFHLSSQRE